MRKLPDFFLESIKDAAGFDRAAFEKIHAGKAGVTSIRLNPGKTMDNRQLSTANHQPSTLNSIDHPVPWSRYGYYLSQRPSFTFDPLFHAGTYYVQEASSMFLEQAFLQLTDLSSSLKVLDLCAAPGGKSTHIQSLISAESLLVSNEVVKNRSHVLRDNVIKWGSSNVIITNNDPVAFQKLEGYFDVMVVDAPCSGSGLFRKDEDAISEWSINNVQLCQQRQQKILGDALPALKQNGLLIYSTCSYSREEDEAIADWLVNEYGMENLPLRVEKDWNIVTSFSSEHKAVGYRFYPDKLKGEGFYISCFRKKEYAAPPRTKLNAIEKVTAKESTIIRSWLQDESMMIIKNDDYFFAIPPSLLDSYILLRSLMNVRYTGVELGQIMKEKLVPAHALALSKLIAQDIPSNEVSCEMAIKYLQRQDINMEISGRGWQLINYHKCSLGWINVLANRVNNYYPKELRILKQQNDRPFQK